MKLKLKVTGANKLTDDRLQVQLQGKSGNAQLYLPIDQQKFVQIGDEWTLDSGKGEMGIGELDETEAPKETHSELFRVLTFDAKRPIELEDEGPLGPDRKI